jgi:hypothetical protein
MGPQKYEWAHQEAQTGLCPLGTVTDHTYIVDRFPFPPDRRPGPHTGPPIPRRPGPVRGVCTLTMSSKSRSNLMGYVVPHGAAL